MEGCDEFVRSDREGGGRHRLDQGYRRGHRASPGRARRQGRRVEPQGRCLRQSGGRHQQGAAAAKRRSRSPATSTTRSSSSSWWTGTRAKWGHIDVLVCNAALNPYFGPQSGISRRGLRQDHGCERASQPLAVPAGAAGDGRAQGRLDHHRVLDRRLARIGVLGAYCISKAADFQLARNIAVEYGPHNVRANCIAPGLIKTDFARALWENPEILEALDRRHAAAAHRRAGRDRGRRRVPCVEGGRVHDRTVDRHRWRLNHRVSSHNKMRDVCNEIALRASPLNIG